MRISRLGLKPAPRSEKAEIGSPPPWQFSVESLVLIGGSSFATFQLTLAAEHLTSRFIPHLSTHCDELAPGCKWCLPPDTGHMLFVMGHGCPLRPKQVNGSPRPPPLQRTLSVARGSLDKGILIPKISRMRVHISRMRSRSAGYAANAALP